MAKYMDNIIITDGFSEIDAPFKVRTSGVVRDQKYHSTPGTKQGDVMLTLFFGGEGRCFNSLCEIKVEAGIAAGGSITAS